MDSYKIHLSEAEMPQEWYNIIPDLPSPLPPYLHPGTGQPITPGRPGGHLSLGLDRAGSEPGALDSHPRRGAAHLSVVAAQPPAPGLQPGEGPEDPGPHLL